MYVQKQQHKFWRQDLCRRRTTGLEQSAAQSQTMWAVIQSVQMVAEDIFIRKVRAQRSVNSFLKYSYLLTYLSWSTLDRLINRLAERLTR